MVKAAWTKFYTLALEVVEEWQNAIEDNPRPHAVSVVAGVLIAAAVAIVL